MFEQYSNPFASMTQNFAATTLKANNLAFQNFERVMGLQLKTFQDTLNATVAFMGEAAEVRDMDGAKAIWPKGVALVKESTETLYSTGQEVLGSTLKTSEAIGQIYKSQFEDAGHSVVKTASKAAKAK
ncbi:phasin family protein [Chiayiivirga flava]|uniref:Phasin domain-containing protein n=1 Tax=Chiayiivirga flava TaxID=659595 RepID=A0A7W8DBC5_9GAMM|nr:phasin family protein [Chiayiivirga flava]MBB5209583.1 hypothetical protein [Chiayiivirga flava]